MTNLPRPKRHNGTSKCKGTELESAGANTAKEAETERSKLQTSLDQANAEIERLKTEVEQQKATQPEQGNSVSPAPEETLPPPGQ
jgi:hypothetical protein